MATACAESAEPRDLHLYGIAQIRSIEQAAFASVPPFTLMQRAGSAIAARALQLLHASSPTPRVLVLAGPGNNGGDALVAAAVLAEQGIHVSIWLPGAASGSSADITDTIGSAVNDGPTGAGDAARALQQAIDSAAHFLPSGEMPERSGWSLAIDGLFGIGLSRAPGDSYREAIAWLNQLRCPVLAIDVPSGLNADTGAVVGDVAVLATHTLSFLGNKPGLHTAHGRDHAGRVRVDYLGTDERLYATPASAPLAMLNDVSLFAAPLRPRLHASHKGSHGDLTVIGGAAGMGGAVLLAARMAAMAGAGRVFAAFAGDVPPFDPVHPELMCRDAHDIARWLAHEPTRGALVAGPGLGQSREANDLLAQVLACRLPLVLDADALNLLAEEAPLQHKLAARTESCLLTPHPLEAARLMGMSASEVQAHRLQVAGELARRFRAIVILKGSGSVIAAPDGRLVINANGNPALATAGSGDVLSGLCGALLAQQWPAWEAALAAVWLHGRAADEIVGAGVGPIGVRASELMPAIRAVLNRLVSSA